MNYLIDFQFRKAQRQDFTVSFFEPATSSVMYEMSQLPGVIDSETMRAVATRIRFQHRSRRVGIMGLESEPRLFRLLNEDEQPVRVPEHGIMLNSKLAELLGVQLGDLVTVEVLEDKRPVAQVEVTAIVNEFGGTQRLHGQNTNCTNCCRNRQVASGAFLKVDPNYLEDVFQELVIPAGRGQRCHQGRDDSEFYGDDRRKHVDDALVQYSVCSRDCDRSRLQQCPNFAVRTKPRFGDDASDRVYSQRKFRRCCLGEIILFTLVAIPLGWLIGYGLAALMILGLDTENYRIPLVVSRTTFAFAAMVVIVGYFSVIAGGAAADQQAGFGLRSEDERVSANVMKFSLRTLIWISVLLAMLLAGGWP